MENNTHAKSLTDRKRSSHLPECIVQEILLRLPVKCIMKFKCVSKSWLCLISSRHFIQAHLRFSMEKSRLNGQMLMLSNICPTSNPIQFSVGALLNETTSADMLNMDYPMQDPPTYVRTVGSCHGLICLEVDLKDLFLWNPSTKESKKLPSIGLEVKKYYHTIAHGFGFNESDNDYKVVAILRIFESQHIMMVYSLRSGSWKRFEDLGSGIPLSPSVSFAAGKIHWLVTPGMGLDFKLDIAWFDLESETCGILEQPDYEKDYANRCTLGVVGGCICVVHYDSDIQVDVWVLKEYGVKGSWSRVFEFPFIDKSRVFVLAKPLCLLPSGDMILVHGRSFIVSNPRSHDSFTVLDHPLLDRFNCVDVFVESLVSPTMEG